MSDYSPATIDAETLAAVTLRLDRYLARHGSPYGETPLSPADRDDARQSILADWWGDDWTAREWTMLQRSGRVLFPATLSETGRHVRAMLFHAGRARKRGWRAEGATRRVADKRRETDGFDGVGQASRAADPARLVAAVESVSGELILSREASRFRARKGLPVKYRGGAAFVPGDAPAAFRWMRRRSNGGYTLDVVERREDKTIISIRPYTRHNFERVGQVPNRAVVKSRAKLPAGIGAGDCRECLNG